MLDIKSLRQDPQATADNLLRRGHSFDLDAFRALDERRKAADMRSQGLQGERKAASKQIGKLIAQGKSVDEAKAEVDGTLARIATQIDEAAREADDANSALTDLLMGVPNLLADDVPDGASEDDNAFIDSWGEPPAFDFEPKDHVDIGQGLGLLDVQSATKITGSRFTVLRGVLARLHRALTQFMLDVHISEHGYEEIYVPYIVNRDSLMGTGTLPKFEEDLFKLRSDNDYYLIPTAEVPVTNMARDRIFEDAELAEDGLRFVSHTPCFRSEAGSYGRDTRGMIRQHQFEKVELVHFVRPSQSDAALEQLTRHAETILERLDLPYRKVALCAGDIGFSARRTYDLEVWLPGQNTYREISSCSSFGDFQARRMQARWRNPDTGKPELLHTLNGSGLAVGRTLVAVLENFQNRDGSVRLPGALQAYMGGLDTLRP
ncbi:MAG: serine--tRNA ligase [Pseudomonadota bacterium]